MNIIKVLVHTLTFTLVSCAIFTSEQKTRIESFVQAVMDCRNMPGLTLAVVKKDETWTKGFGIADREKGVPVTTDSLFGIGSVTKAFTTTLIAMLLNDTNGRLTWTSKVSDILGPQFSFVDEVRTRELTLRDLFTHRTGLIPADLALYAGYDHTFTRAEFARRFRFLPEEKPSRDVWEYNNWVYGLAGYIVQVLSGESYEDTLDKRIFQPLGMSKSRVLGKTATTEDDGVAKPYYMVEDSLVLTSSSIYDIHPGEAAGAIVSSADDMSKWMHFLLRGGKTLNNDSLVSSKLLQEAFDIHESLPNNWINSRSLFSPTYPASDVHFGYGYAWFLSTYKGYRKHWHSGGLHAYTTYFHIYPDLDVSIFTSTNGPGITGTGTGEKLIEYYIVDSLLEEEPWLNISTSCSFPLPWKKPTSTSNNNSDVTNLDIECTQCYTGRYGHQLYGDLEVRIEPTIGSLMLHYGRLKGSLNSTNDETKFKLDIWEPFRLFSRPGNNTMLVSVIFHEKEKGTYQSIDLNMPYSMTFSRKVSFKDEITASGQNQCSNGELFVSLTVSVLVLISTYKFDFS